MNGGAVRQRALWAARALSHDVTLQIGARWGKNFPMHFVCGYPRSGTSWISEVLADYLNLPRPREYVLPLAFPCVVHTHAEAKRNIRPCIYVVRDGRDCLVSAYTRMVKRLAARQGILAKHYRKLFGANADLSDARRYFPIFVDDMLSSPKGTVTNWGMHVGSWLDRAGDDLGVVVVSYEKLLDEGVGYLDERLRQLYGGSEYAALEEAFGRHSIAAVQQFGEARAGTSVRKGIAGNWVNWFDRATAQRFHEVCGETLIRMGYEDGTAWVSRCAE